MTDVIVLVRVSALGGSLTPVLFCTVLEPYFKYSQYVPGTQFIVPTVGTQVVLRYSSQRLVQAQNRLQSTF